MVDNLLMVAQNPAFSKRTKLGPSHALKYFAQNMTSFLLPSAENTINEP